MEVVSRSGAHQSWAGCCTLNLITCMQSWLKHRQSLLRLSQPAVAVLTLFRMFEVWASTTTTISIFPQGRLQQWQLSTMVSWISPKLDLQNTTQCTSTAGSQATVSVPPAVGSVIPSLCCHHAEETLNVAFCKSYASGVSKHRLGHWINRTSLSNKMGAGLG